MEAFAKVTVNKLEQRIKEARDKFREHAKATGVIAACRFVICSEDGDASETDGLMYEQHIAKLFMNRSATWDKTGLIDSIIYIRDPDHTLSGGDGHWFKWVTRKGLSSEKMNDIGSFGHLIIEKLWMHFAACGRDVAPFGPVRHGIA
ncbi:hypothetical protein GFPCMMHI_02596 [Ensifer adhaerens]|nr:hypothetical protein [Ensifer adhaerens]